MIKYCLPIIANDVAVVEETIGTQQANFDYFEVWLDYLSEFRADSIKKWCARCGARLVLLFRRQGLEPIRLSAERRHAVMEIAAEMGSLVDLDIETQLEDLEYRASMSSRPAAILSYHNYQTTPDASTLRELAARMKEDGAAISKLACRCNSAEDALRLLGLQQEMVREGRRHIVLGMGEHGAVTRVFGTLWGNEFIFAPLERSAQSAPGQLTRSELEGIFATLRRVGE